MRTMVVTGMVNPSQTYHLWRSWRARDYGQWGAAVVLNGIQARNGHVNDRLAGLLTGAPHALITMGEPAGPIKAFATGVRIAKELGAEFIACLHDDLRIDEDDWVNYIETFFDVTPKALLLGFGGAYGVGSPDWNYVREAKSGDELVAALARHDFISNMQEAEVHGRRVDTPQRVAVLDGFSLIGRVDFMAYAFDVLEKAELVHHAYDTAISLMAHDEPGEQEVWMLPVACHHHGGLSAVAMPEYHQALNTRGTSDAEEWMRSHRWLYRSALVQGRLPLDVRGR